MPEECNFLLQFSSISGVDDLAVNQDQSSIEGAAWLGLGFPCPFGTCAVGVRSFWVHPSLSPRTRTLKVERPVRLGKTYEKTYFYYCIYDLIANWMVIKPKRQNIKKTLDFCRVHQRFYESVGDAVRNDFDVIVGHRENREGLILSPARIRVIRFGDHVKHVTSFERKITVKLKDG